MARSQLEASSAGGKTRAQIFAERAAPPELRWRRDPVAWAEERAKLELWSKQKEILMSLVDNRNTAVKSCHSAGKSFISSVATCWWLDCHLPGTARVITTAPTSKQVDAVLWYEINKMHRRLGLQGQCNLREWYIGSQMVALGRKPPDHQQAAFQGLHAEFLLVIYDEAYGIPRSLWNEGSSLASNAKARQLAIGNPDGPGAFQENCNDGGWNVIHISYRNTPNFTEEAISGELADMLIHPDWVNERRMKWGESSALFVSKCEGDFPAIGGDPWQVIPRAWLDQCLFLDYPAGQQPIEAGIDVGKTHDRTVVTVRQGRKITYIETFVNPDPMQTVAQLANVLREHQVQTAKVDSIGIGWGIYGRLRELSSVDNTTGNFTTHNANVVPINVSLRPTYGNEALYYNRRSEMWWLGRELSRTKAWDFSALNLDQQTDLIHELTMARFEIVDSQGKVKVESNELIIKRLGNSPDLATAALLAFVPASWAGDTSTSTMLETPSLIGSISAFDAMTPMHGVMSGLGIGGSKAWYE